VAGLEIIPNREAYNLPFHSVNSLNYRTTCTKGSNVWIISKFVRRLVSFFRESPRRPDQTLTCACLSVFALHWWVLLVLLMRAAITTPSSRFVGRQYQLTSPHLSSAQLSSVVYFVFLSFVLSFFCLLIEKWSDYLDVETNPSRGFDRIFSRVKE